MTWNVTITGADDSIEPYVLERLTDEFPFVEWGILLSVSRFGQPRYPSLGWLLELERYRAAGGSYQPMAMHLCGVASLATAAGKPMWLPNASFGRVQLNGIEPTYSPLPRFRGEYILQARPASLEAVAAWARAQAQKGQAVSVLCDGSGGRGVRHEGEWPTPPEGVRLGYAGGIGPDNVTEVLRSLEGRAPTWIDLESGVRTDDDRFDLAKVRAVLEAVKAHGAERPAPGRSA